MVLQTHAEPTASEILQEAATIIEARNRVERERKIASVIAAAKVWREDCERLGATTSAARQAFEMFEGELRRVVT